jgi:hypothetical protein
MLDMVAGKAQRAKEIKKANTALLPYAQFG